MARIRKESSHCSAKKDTYGEQLNQLRKKWGDVIYSSVGQVPSVLSAFEPQAKVASLYKDVLPILLENQEVQFKRGDQPRANPDDVYDIICKVIMRMTMPKLISVQPLTMPAGVIFFLRYTPNKDTTVSEYDYGVQPDVMINLTVESRPASAQTELLQALWLLGSESMQDLAATQNEDALHTLKEAMIDSIAGALDRTIMKNLYHGVRDQRVFELTNPGSTGEFLDAAKALWKRGLRPPDWIIGGLDMTVKFMGNNDFEVKPEIFYVGQARGIHVWCDVMMPDRAAVMGGGPRGPLDSGFIWSPYVLLTPKPREVTVTNSQTKVDIQVLDDRRKILTRHAMTLCNPDRYLVLKRK